MSLIKKIDLFTDKRVKYIKKYISEIKEVQLIKKQLGGTEQSIDELLSASNTEFMLIQQLSTQVNQQIIEAYTLIEELKRDNKTCNDNLLLKTQQMEELAKEINDKYVLLEQLRSEQLDEIFKARISKFGNVSYYESLPEEIKRELRSYSDADLPIFFNYTTNIQANDINKLREIIRTIEVRKFLIENVIKEVLSHYDTLTFDIKRRLIKLPEEQIQILLNRNFIERTKSLNISQLEKDLSELERRNN